MEADEMTARDPLIYDLEELGRFEYRDALGELFRRLDYDAEITPSSSEEGRDLVLKKQQRTTIVECRNNTSPVGRPAIRKLHQVLTDEEDARRGIVISPGGFSDEATSRVREITRQNNLSIELWDLEELIARGREADVFFQSLPLSAHVFYHVPWNDASRLPDIFTERYLQPLASSPREAAGAVEIVSCERRYLPAVEARYSVEKRFTVSSREIYRAHDSGSRLYFVGDEEPDEKLVRFLEESTTRLLDEKVSGLPADVFSRQRLKKYRTEVAGEIAEKLTKTVEYTDDNHSYTRHCEVEPYDVEVNLRLIFVARNEIAFRAGPRDYRFAALDVRDDDWTFLSEASGFEDGIEGLRDHDGVLCNDCGALVPASEGTACEDCGRTLCGEHRWRWPAGFPRLWPPLCASCFTGRDPEPEPPDETPLAENALLIPLLGLVPGLSFLMGERYVTGGALVLFTLLVELGILLGSPAGTVLVGHLFLLLPVAIGLAASTYWWLRLRIHRSSTQKLADYSPAWH